MGSRDLRFAIIGAGRPNQNLGSHDSYNGVGEYHAMAIVKYARLEAVCSKSENSAHALADKFGVKNVYTDYRRILERKDIDAVTIAVPSGLHGDIAIEAAQAGKHILLEKPIDVTLEKAEKVVAECEERNIKLCVAFHHRFGVLREVKEAVERGDMGKLVVTNAFCRRYRTKEYYTQSGWRGTWNLDGGGCLMNQGIHILDAMLWIAGCVESVSGFTVNRTHPYIEVEDSAVASLKFFDGSLGILEATTSCYPDLSDRIEIHGELGSIILDGYPLKILLQISKGKKVRALAGTGKKQPPMYSSMHDGLIRDLVEAIQTDREPLVNGHEGLKSLVLIDAIYKSAKSGKRIDFALAFGGAH